MASLCHPQHACRVDDFERDWDTRRFASSTSPERVIAGNVTVAGVEYPLYTHVHHGYGLNDAFDRSVTLLTRHLPRGRGLLDEVNAWLGCCVNDSEGGLWEPTYA